MPPAPRAPAIPRRSPRRGSSENQSGSSCENGSRKDIAKMMARNCSFILGILFAVSAAAQEYPSRPVKLVIPFPPGGSNDVVGRVIGAQLSERLGQSVVVENRGGGGGTLGINAAAKAPADGYTLLLMSVGYPMSIALGQMPRESLQWFTPVATVGTGPSILVVPGSLPVQSMKDLVALAKSRPGALNAGSAGPGSFQHLATELFRLQAGIDVVIVQYKGGGAGRTHTNAGGGATKGGSGAHRHDRRRGADERRQRHPELAARALREVEGPRHRRRQAPRRDAGGSDVRGGGPAGRGGEQLVGHRGACWHAGAGRRAPA